jgi:hypothetical protein
MKSILAVSIALLATSAQAGLRWFSKCPTVSSVSWDATMGVPSNHKLLYLDTTADWAIKTVKSFYSAFPNLQCFNLAALAGQPFGFDESTYANIFIEEILPYYNKVLYWDSFTKTHVNYLCLDVARADMLVDWAFTQYNVQIPSWVAKIFTKVFYLFSIDGIAIFSDSNSVSPNVEYNIQSAVRSKVSTSFDFTKEVAKYTC